jgi:ABC-2 type transport system permease protein
MRALKVMHTIWLRDVITFRREQFRIVAMIGQPLLYLLLLGQGIAAGMTLKNSPAIDYLKFMYPGIIGMTILFTSLSSAMSVIWDREFGFLKEVLVAPVPRWGVAIGKALGGATVSMVQAAILIVMAPVARVSLAPLVAVKLLGLAFLISFAATNLGLAIASRMESMQSFTMVMNLLVMPLYFLSGAMFPLTSAPGWMKPLMTINPLTYGVDALRTVVFSAAESEPASVASTTLFDVAKRAGIVSGVLSLDVGIVAGTALVLAAASAYAFRRSN